VFEGRSFGHFDSSYPSALQGLISPQEFSTITARIDRIWEPVVIKTNKATEEVGNVGCCLCICCPCSCGLSLFCLCCYLLCKQRTLRDVAKTARHDLKEYFTELNQLYADRGVEFLVSPTIEYIYIEIKIKKQEHEEEIIKDEGAKDQGEDTSDDEQAKLLKTIDNID